MIKKILLLSGLGFAAMAQSNPLTDLSTFRTPASNWSLVGNVSADYQQLNQMISQQGSGVIFSNQPLNQRSPKADLLTNETYGDFDLSVDFMLPRGGSSGIFLQDRYEIQLADSWGAKRINIYDLGAVSERLNPGQKEGFEGTPPTQNAAKAPGLWQNIKISFQAPKFDASGKKIKNAVVLGVMINGVLVQKNVELSGPTRGINTDEVKLGPVRFEGGNSCVAFKNLQISHFDQPTPTLSNISYKTYEGEFKKASDLNTKASKSTGQQDKLTYEVLSDDNNFGLDLNGTLTIPTAGKYTFTIGHGGSLQMMVDGNVIFKDEWGFTTNSRSATTDLTAGTHKIAMLYYKTDGWMQPRLALTIGSDKVRQTELSAFSSGLLPSPLNPILIKTDIEPVVHRSFMDYAISESATKRVVKTVSVGNKDGIHYSYDLETGTLFQAWKGDFLDATPMWNDRGDGSSKPLGAVLQLGIQPSLADLTDASATWPSEPKNLTVKGYELDDAGNPTFKYLLGSASVSEKTLPDANAMMLTRSITVEGSKTLSCKLAEGSKIEETNGMYLIDGKYFIKTASAKIRNINGKQELIALVGGSLTYSIIW